MGISTKSVAAWKRAGNTDKWTEILFRALTSRVAKRWRFVSFRGTGGGEWRGVVDVLAIRKDTAKSDHEVLKSGDLFEIVLVQMKGGSALNPTDADVRRLQAVKQRYRAIGVVLFAWEKGVSAHFSKLKGRRWVQSSVAVYCVVAPIMGHRPSKLARRPYSSIPKTSPVGTKVPDSGTGEFGA
jgi:hypothetical protein